MPVPTPAPIGTSEPSLTEEQAADVFEGLLARDADTEDTDETPRDSETPDEGDEVDDLDPESDPDSDDDTEQSPDDDESDTDEEQDDDDDEEPKALYSVKIDGKEHKVTLNEALKGYSREQDYTRKTQAVAERQKALEAREQEIVTKAQHYDARLADVERTLSSASAEPDWDAIRKEHPQEFPALYAEWKIAQGEIDQARAAIKAERDKVASELSEKQKAAETKRLTVEREKLLEALPAWKDAKVAKRESAAIIATVTAAGFTSEELSKVTDHRLLLVLRKAALYDRAQKAKPPLVRQEERTKVLAAGKRGRRQVSSGIVRAKERLAQTGSVEDAAAVFENMLTRRPKRR